MSSIKKKSNKIIKIDFKKEINDVLEYLKESELISFTDKQEESKWKYDINRTMNTKYNKDIKRKTKVDVLILGLSMCLEEKEEMEKQCAKYGVKEKQKLCSEIKALRNENEDLKFRVSQLEDEVSLLKRKLNESEERVAHLIKKIEWLTPSFTNSE